MSAFSEACISSKIIKVFSGRMVMLLIIESSLIILAGFKSFSNMPVKSEPVSKLKYATLSYSDCPNSSIL